MTGLVLLIELHLFVCGGSLEIMPDCLSQPQHWNFFKRERSFFSSIRFQSADYFQMSFWIRKFSHVETHLRKKLLHVRIRYYKQATKLSVF
jgi:hypothetical protein